MASPTSQLRGDVLEHAINIEWFFHAIISQHYFGQVRHGFISEVLYDEQCSFGLKLRVLLKICPDLSGDVEQKLRRLNSIRNSFAHVGQEFIDGPNPHGASRIPSSKDFSKSVDFGRLHTEFLVLEKPVLEALLATFKGKGGTIYIPNE
jgi:hypothetical protein